MIIRNEYQYHQPKGIAFWLVVFLFACSSVVAQSGFNQRDHFGLHNAALTSLHVTDSVIYGLGVARASSGGNLGSLLVRFDQNGAVLSAKHTVDSSMTLGTWCDCLVEDGSGFAALGYAQLQGSTNTEVLFVKYNEQGDTSFTRRFHLDSFSTQLEGYWKPQALMAVDSTGYFAVGDVSLGNANSDFLMIRLDSQGDLMWSTLEGTSNRDVSETIHKREDGGFMIGGWTDDQPWSNEDYLFSSYLVELDSAGNVENEWVSNTTGLRGPALDLLPTNNNHLFVASSRPVAVPIAGGEMLMYQNAVYELDENRTVVWDYYLDHELDAEFLQNKLFYNTDSTQLIIAGTVYDSLPGTSQFRRRAWLQAFDLTTREVLWRRYIEAPVVTYGAATQIYDVEQLPDGGFLLCGDARDNDPNEVMQQGWLIRTDSLGCVTSSCESVGLDDIQLHKAMNVLVFPNPAKIGTPVELAVENGLTSSFDLIVTDLFGKPVPVEFSQEYDRVVLDTKYLEAGIYQVTITNATYQKTARVVILN